MIIIANAFYKKMLLDLSSSDNMHIQKKRRDLRIKEDKVKANLILQRLFDNYIFYRTRYMYVLCFR